MKTLNIACCGGWHPHAKHFAMDRAKTHCSDFSYKFVAVWDDREDRGREWAEEMGCRFEPDYDKLVASPDVDAVIITAATTQHAEMCVKAANAGKHIYVEKAFATTKAAAEAVRDAVRKNNVHFIISDPPARGQAILLAKRYIDEGKLGQVTFARVRMGHDEALTNKQADEYYDIKLGGGAMIDMGHHTLHSLALLLGAPVKATAVLKTITERGKKNGVDENSVAILEFDGDAIGLAETGWATGGNQGGFDILGTEGGLSMRSRQLTYIPARGAPENIPNELLPEAEMYPLRYWMYNIFNDKKEEMFDIDIAVLLSAVEEAIYESARTGAGVAVK